MRVEKSLHHGVVPAAALGRHAAADLVALQQHSQQPRPTRRRAPRDLDARSRMDRRLRSKAGQAIYGLYKPIVEPVFGQIKSARGVDRFRLRGVEKVNGDWAWTLIATTHNLLKPQALP